MAPNEKPGPGRTTKYIPAFAKVAAQMCQRSATDADLAAAFGVPIVTIWNWQSRYPESINRTGGGTMRFGHGSQRA